MEKLSFRDKIGYSIASIGDSISYMFVATFILFFLTTVAGIQPAVAGAITAIGSVWDALINPIIGYLSDHTRTRWGKRRPFMLGFCIPLFAAIILLFTAVDINNTLKILYYTLMIMAFWTSFTGFFVPYYAMGAEYTQNYGERTKLRAYASFFNMIGTLLSMAMPTFIVEQLEGHGVTVLRAWQLTAVFLALVTALSILITVFLSKGKDVCCENTKTGESGLAGVFNEYLQVLKLKPMRWLLLTSMCYLIAYELILSDFVYLLTYNLGFSGSEVSAAMLMRSTVALIVIAPVAKLCLLTDKRTGYLVVISFGVTGLVVMRFMPLDNIVCLAAFIVVAAITTQTYWQIVPAMFYDVCEYDEYKTGKRRVGAIVSVQGLVEAFAAGLGAQILGIILQVAGFEGSAKAQSATASEWILNCTTWVPVIFLVIAGFAVYRFPITGEKYDNMMKKLEERKK